MKFNKEEIRWLVDRGWKEVKRQRYGKTDKILEYLSDKGKLWYFD